MAECNLVGGPPHVWAPHGPVDVKCERCGVQQNWHGAWGGLMRRLDEQAKTATAYGPLDRLRDIVDEACGMQPADTTHEELLTLLERHIADLRVAPDDDAEARLMAACCPHCSKPGAMTFHNGGGVCTMAPVSPAK